MKGLITVALSLQLISCTKDEDADSGDQIYTLYRNGVFAKEMRFHIATFPTDGEKPEWNKENCEKVANFFNESQKEKGHDARFWCEKGDFKK